MASLRALETRNLSRDALRPPLNTAISGSVNASLNHLRTRGFLPGETTEAVWGVFITFYARIITGRDSNH